MFLYTKKLIFSDKWHHPSYRSAGKYWSTSNSSRWWLLVNINVLFLKIKRNFQPVLPTQVHEHILNSKILCENTSLGSVEHSPLRNNTLNQIKWAKAYWKYMLAIACWLSIKYSGDAPETTVENKYLFFFFFKGDKNNRRLKNRKYVQGITVEREGNRVHDVWGENIMS